MTDGGSNEPKVLLVDDEVDYLEDFRSLFSEKFNIVTASGGEEALEILRRESVGVIVSDQRMPKMTGSELLSEVASRHPETVRVLYTGYSDMEAIIDAVNKGEIYRYLSKDASLEDVETTIRQAVEKYKLGRVNGFKKKHGAPLVEAASQGAPIGIQEKRGGEGTDIGLSGKKTS